MNTCIKSLNTPEGEPSRWMRIQWWWNDLFKFLPWSVREKYYDIRDWMFPRHKWLTKKIPNNWVDKDTILEICIFESIKHFVDKDGEDAFGVLCNDNPPDQKRFMDELREMYGFITVKLPDLQKQLDEAWDKVPHVDFKNLNDPNRDYNKTYGEVDRLEKEISDLKTRIMVWAVTNREGMWT